MTRSVWKGPFVDMYLIKKAEEKISKGMCDLVLERSQIKQTICTLAKILKKKQDLAVINENKDDSKDITGREILPKTAESI